MKKKFFSRIGLILFAVVMVTGCRKQSPETENPDDVYMKSGSNAKQENSYRLLASKRFSDEVSDPWTDQTWTYEYSVGKRGFAPKENNTCVKNGNQNVLNLLKFKPKTFRNKMIKTGSISRKDIKLNRSKLGLKL